jgi:hypothetical protein
VLCVFVLGMSAVGSLALWSFITSIFLLVILIFICRFLLIFLDFVFRSFPLWLTISALGASVNSIFLTQNYSLHILAPLFPNLHLRNLSPASKSSLSTVKHIATMCNTHRWCLNLPGKVYSSIPKMGKCSRGISS